MPAKDQPRQDPPSSNPRADAALPLTRLELRELIEETALLHAKRRGRRLLSVGDLAAAETEVLQRLGL